MSPSKHLAWSVWKNITTQYRRASCTVYYDLLQLEHSQTRFLTTWLTVLFINVNIANMHAFKQKQSWLCTVRTESVKYDAHFSTIQSTQIKTRRRVVSSSYLRRWEVGFVSLFVRRIIQKLLSDSRQIGVIGLRHGNRWFNFGEEHGKCKLWVKHHNRWEVDRPWQRPSSVVMLWTAFWLIGRLVLASSGTWTLFIICIHGKSKTVSLPLIQLS